MSTDKPIENCGSTAGDYIREMVAIETGSDIYLYASSCVRELKDRNPDIDSTTLAEAAYIRGCAQGVAYAQELTKKLGAA